MLVSIIMYMATYTVKSVLGYLSFMPVALSYILAVLLSLQSESKVASETPLYLVMQSTGYATLVAKYELKQPFIFCSV